MSYKPRLLYILHNHPGFLAGTECHTKALFAGLRDKYDTWIVFPHEGGLLLTDDLVDAFRYPVDVFNPGFPPYKLRATSQSLHSIFRKVRPDLIHIQHFLNWPLNVIDLATHTGVPVILSLHDYYAITPDFTMMHDVRLNATLSAKYAITTFGQDVSKYLRLRREALNKSLSKVSAIIVPSQFLSDVMCKVFSCKCRVISHGIRSFEKQPRRDHSVNFVFGYVGNLIPSKGWRLLLEAFPEVRAAYPQSELHYFGAGSHKSKSIEGVVYHGEYDQEQLPHIFSEIDVVIIPSVVAEAFCLTLSEAWMAGCAVAVSDIGALGERVIDRVNGKKFKAGNVESIRNALRWFLENDCWKRWDIEQPKSLGEMLLEYDGLYQEFLKWKAGTIRS